MCLISLNKDRIRSKPARVRTVSRSRIHSSDRSGVPSSGRRVLEERSPRGTSQRAQSGTIRPSPPAPGIHANQSHPPSTSERTLLPQQQSTASERHQSQSKGVSTQAGANHERLSQYVEVEYYASSISSDSPSSYEGAQGHRAYQQSKTSGYPKAKPRALGSTRINDQGRDLERESSNVRARQERHVGGQRKSAAKESSASRNRKSAP